MFLIDARLIDALPADWTRPSPKKREEIVVLPLPTPTGPSIFELYQREVDRVIRRCFVDFSDPLKSPPST